MYFAGPGAALSSTPSRLNTPPLFTRFLRRRSQAADDLLAGPIRGDLLGADHLAERARAVARQQRISKPEDACRDARLLARLKNTQRILTDAYQRLDAAYEHHGDIGPAGVWLLDNYHVIQEHIREVHASLPRGYYRELPQLARGLLQGYPIVSLTAVLCIVAVVAAVSFLGERLDAGSRGVRR